MIGSEHCGQVIKAARQLYNRTNLKLSFAKTHKRLIASLAPPPPPLPQRPSFSPDYIVGQFKIWKRSFLFFSSRYNCFTLNFFSSSANFFSEKMFLRMRGFFFSLTFKQPRNVWSASFEGRKCSNLFLSLDSSASF